MLGCVFIQYWGCISKAGPCSRVLHLSVALACMHEGPPVQLPVSVSLQLCRTCMVARFKATIPPTRKVTIPPSMHDMSPSMHGTPPSMHDMPPSMHGTSPSMHGTSPSMHGTGGMCIRPTDTSHRNVLAMMSLCVKLAFRESESMRI